MNTTAQRTPGPWSVCSTVFDHAVSRWHITSAKHGSVYPICEHVLEAGLSADEQIANAAFIVEACNNYESVCAERFKLAQALRELLGVLPGRGNLIAVLNARAALHALEKVTP